MERRNTPYKQYLTMPTNEESVISGDTGIVFKNLGLTTEYSNPFTLTSSLNAFNVICTTEAKMTLTNKYKFSAMVSHDVPEFLEYGFTGVKEFIGGIDKFIYSIPNNTTLLRLPFYFSKLELSDVVTKAVARNSSIVFFDFGNSPLIEGNINVFSNIKNLKRIYVHYCPRVYGTIADLKSITTLEYFTCPNTQVDGTIEEFVAGQRAAGRTTGTVNGSPTNWGLVTFDGETTHAKGAVDWTANTITMDGVTINA